MASNPQHEPTMEEILASIRKIISEDSTEQAPAEPPKPAEPESDILELTQEVTPAPEPAPFVAHEPEPEPVIEAPAPAPEPAPENDLVFENIEPAEPATPPGGIFTDKHREHLQNAFAALDEPEEAPPAPRSSAVGGSVEAVFERAVRDAFEPVAKAWLTENAPHLVDAMKPLISAWLDEHFPPLIEAAVREEVARARGKKA